MRAHEFLTNPNDPASAVGESNANDDASFQRRIAAKKRTLADIKMSIDMDKVHNDQKNIGKTLADILARHRKESIRLAKDK